MALVISWLKVLEDEGWHIVESEGEIRGEHDKSKKRWLIRKSAILKAGNPERFPTYERHSMTDYLLEIVLDHPNIIQVPIKTEISERKLVANNSKDELQFILGRYETSIIKQIVGATSRDIIPESIKKDILYAI